MASLRLSIVVWILISGVSLFICQFLPAQDNEKGNDVTQAIIRYQKTIAENPDSVEARLSLGLAYLAYDILEEAILAFQKTIELDPKSEKGNYWLGRTYQLQKKYEESIAIFRELIRLFPNHCEIYIQLGLSYFQLHQHKEAEEAFQTAKDTFQNKIIGSKLPFVHIDKKFLDSGLTIIDLVLFAQKVTLIIQMLVNLLIVL